MNVIVELPRIMARCLVCTVLIEAAGAAVLGVRDKRDFLNVILVNVMTNPVVAVLPVYMNIRYGIGARHAALAALEAFAVLSEAAVYKRFLRYEKLRPLVLSIVLNAMSYFCGVFINGL